MNLLSLVRIQGEITGGEKKKRTRDCAYAGVLENDHWFQWGCFQVFVRQFMLLCLNVVITVNVQRHLVITLLLLFGKRKWI